MTDKKKNTEDFTEALGEEVDHGFNAATVLLDDED